MRIFRYDQRYKHAIIRAEFDATRNIKDMRVLAAMLEEKEEEVWAGQHFIPCQHNHDQGGILWQRAYDTHDIIMDHKHPWERVCHTVQGVPVKKWGFL